MSTHENKSVNSDSLVFYYMDEKLYLYASNTISSALIYLCDMTDDFKNFAIDGKLFTNAFSNFPTDEVQFAFLEEENQLVFGNKKTRVSLKTSNVDDMETRLKNEFFIDKDLAYDKLNSSNFYDAFKYTAFSCAPDFDEYPYSSIMFFIEKNKFNAQSSDKHRISVFGNHYNNEVSYLISRNQAELSLSFLNKDDQFSYCIYKNKFLLKWQDNLFVTALDANSYQSVFNGFNKFFNQSTLITSFKIDKNELSKSIKFVSNISGSHTYHMKSNGSELVISSSSNDKGAVADKIALEEEISDIEVSYLTNHFIKVFELLQDDILELSFFDYNGYTICTVENTYFKHIMFPME